MATNAYNPSMWEAKAVSLGYTQRCHLQTRNTAHKHQKVPLLLFALELVQEPPECWKTIALNASNLYVLTHKGNGLYLSAKHLSAMAAASAVWAMPVKLVQLSLSFKILQTEDSFFVTDLSKSALNRTSLS